MQPTRRTGFLSFSLVGAVFLLGGCSFERLPAREDRRAAALATASLPQASGWPSGATDGLVPLTYDFARQRFRLVPVQTGLLKEAFVRVDGRDGPIEFTLTDQVWFYSWNAADSIPSALLAPPPGVAVEGQAVEEALATATVRVRWKYVAHLPFREPRGLFIHLTSLNGSAAEDRLAQEMCDRNWDVMRMAGGTLGPLTFKRSSAPGAADTAPWTPQEREQHVLERGVNLLADYARNVEVALGWVRRVHPEINGKPVVIAAFSLGACMAPTVAARLDGQLDAMLLAGGGANLFGIFADSQIVDFGEDREARDFIRTNRDRLERAYLERVLIDTTRTAPLLARLPVLMILARRDQIVPARYGEQLWELAGCPELWRVDTGHLLMFFLLEGRVREMADWLEKSTKP